MISSSVETGAMDGLVFMVFGFMGEFRRGVEAIASPARCSDVGIKDELSAFDVVNSGHEFREGSVGF